MNDLKVLVVEDEILIRMLLKEQLQHNQCEIVGETGNGSTAIEIAEKNKPDFICMDIKLHNGIDGIEAAKAIHDLNPSIPILFISAYNYYDQINNIDLPNKFGYIEKPIQEAQLSEAIKEIRKNMINSAL
ncbi:MAG: response regulator [Spirochaetales bacterium]|nr:response regulator [Spirochaetales bacterium]